MESHALSHALQGTPSKHWVWTKSHSHLSDLRRTVATHMARLGVSDRTVGKVLNHGTELRRTITARVYIQHDFMAEKKTAAFDNWASELLFCAEKLNTSGNVFAIGSKK